MNPNIPPGNFLRGSQPAPQADMSNVAAQTSPATTAGAASGAPKPALPKRIECPICKTTFAPRASAGRCPVCGEQVVSPEATTRNLPIITPIVNWMFQKGNWRLVAVGALVLYQIIIFIVLWIHLAQIHAL